MLIKDGKKDDSVLSGLFWSFGERIFAQIVTTVVTIILARLLSPTHYGIISVVTVIISFCNIFVNSGFGTAVVQKKEIDDMDFNSAFMISMTISVILYAILFFTAPLLATFYNMVELAYVIRVMGTRLIIASVNTIQHAYIQRQMKFKLFFVATLFGTIISAIIGIILALLGFGVWALVAQYMTNSIIDTMVLLVVCDWKPKFYFDLERAKYLFKFGSKVLCSELIFTLESDLRSLIIGKVFGPSDLAFYDQGKKYPALLVNNVNSSITKVMFPAFSKKQGQHNAFKKMLRDLVSVGTFILSPILIGFSVISHDVVLLLLTEKWIPILPYVHIFCVIYLVRPLESTCHQALLAIGKSDAVMRIMLAINILALLSVIVATYIFHSVLLIAVGSLITTILSLTLFMNRMKLEFNYTFLEQLSDMIPSIFFSISMGFIIEIVNFWDLTVGLGLVIKIVVGIVFYSIMSIIFKTKGYVLVRRIIHFKISARSESNIV